MVSNAKEANQDLSIIEKLKMGIAPTLTSSPTKMIIKKLLKSDATTPSEKQQAK